MIYDCFLFFNELDLLEIRLKYLWDVVDKFIIVESTKTFTGKDKPLLFKAASDRFAWASSKIVYIESELHPNPETPWHNEHKQRDDIMIGWRQVGLTIGDTVLVGDLDEIPSKAAINEIKKLFVETSVDKYSVLMKHYGFYLNGNAKKDWVGTVAVTGNSLLHAKPQELRSQKDNFDKVLGGFHCSYLGGAEKVCHKLQSFSHQEVVHSYMTEDHVASCINLGLAPWHELTETTKTVFYENPDSCLLIQELLNGDASLYPQLVCLNY